MRLMAIQALSARRRCRRCQEDVDQLLVREAEEFLCRTSLPIEPRKNGPWGMPQYGIPHRIHHSLSSAARRKALCVWGRCRLGRIGSTGWYRDGHFSDDLVAACVKMIQSGIRNRARPG